MHHTSARRVISWLLEGSGFGRRGLTLTAASCLGDASLEAVRLRDLALRLGSVLRPDAVTASTSDASHAALPTNERQLCEQFCAEIVAHPAEVGLKLACLGALVRLWPHVGADERARLRGQMLDSFATMPDTSGSSLTTGTLRDWQRHLPTCHGGSGEFNAAVLKDLLEIPDPAAVYRSIADHLFQGRDLGMLYRVVGSLAIRLRLGHRDQHCRLHHAVLGAIAGEELVKHAPPALMATLLAQLTHQLWWCRHHAGLEAFPSGASDSGTGLVAAVAIGDPVQARRAARVASKRPEIFWDDAWTIMEGMLNDEATGWPEALTLLVAIAWRTGHNVISPDDAAILGLVFAEPPCHSLQEAGRS